MDRRKQIAAIIVVVLSLFFGLNDEAVNTIANWIDPIPAGQARVEEVVDGDTIVVRYGDNTERVRLIGVDTPETHHPDKAVQCFGAEASKFLSEKLDGEDVRLAADPTNTNRDRYKRLLRYVYLGDELVNQQIILEGYGFAYVAFPFELKDQFVAAEEQAREAERGLWGGCELEPNGDSFNTAPAEA